jgi:hypothetical protein
MSRDVAPAPQPSSGLLRVLYFALALGAVFVVPRTIPAGDAAAWFDADLAHQAAMARTVVDAIESAPPNGTFYRTGHDRFDGQSAIAIYQIALLGLGQVLLAHPEKKAEYASAMRHAAEHLVDPKLLPYAAAVYGHHGTTRMDPGEGHAYMGYVNLGLGMLRLVDPTHPLAKVHDRLTEDLARRLDASTHGLIETYPGETWPPDVAAVAGSIGLYDRVTGKDHGALLARWAERYASCAIDPHSQLLVQRVNTGTCTPVDAPRGSGTALASYFIGFAAPPLAHALYVGLTKSAAVEVFGFGGMREYATGSQGVGDVNAGPVVFGVSVGATGYAVGAARAQGDRPTFVALYRSTHLFGLPTTHGDRLTFAAGGVLGNALLFAMLTARPIDAPWPVPS